MHEIGANIGYDYGLTTGERSTQLIMRAFHSGGTVGAGDSLASGFARLRELLSAPESVRAQGTLALHDGKVTDISLAPQGGYYVTVHPDKLGETEPAHYVPSGRTLKVKLNDHVKAGDPLSDGAYRPQDIAALKGSLAAQQYVVDEARKSFQAAGAVVRKPVLEVVAAATLRWVEITDDGGEPDLAPGDMLHENDYLARKAKNSRIQAVPTVPGLSSLPIKRSKDPLERLNFQRLTDALTEAPAVHAKSDLVGRDSPLPGLAYGALFRPVHEGDTAFNRGAIHGT
jgi:DNA-directed RNA polymerase subunit beta'